MVLFAEREELVLMRRKEAAFELDVVAEPRLEGSFGNLEGL